MMTQDVRPGLVVEFEGTEFVVLDRHPKRAHWWLQRKSDGDISEGRYAHPEDLVLVGDSTGRADLLTFTNRAGQRGAFIVRGELGEWVLTRSPEGWRISHRPTSLRAADFKTRKKAEEVMAELHENIVPTGTNLPALKEQRISLANILQKHLAHGY